MEVAFSAWGNNRGRHSIFDRDISEVNPSDPEYYESQSSYIEMRENGLTIIGKTVEPVELGADNGYRLNVYLSKQEIANLARIAFKDEPFANVVKMLSGENKS